jgi:hypothetical protein
MRKLIVCALLSLPFICFSQKKYKNEFSIRQSVGYFFDSTRLIASHWTEGNSLTIGFQYRRLISSKWSIRGCYSESSFRYFNRDSKYSSLKFHSILRRTITRYTIDMGYLYSIKNFNVNLNSGLTYHRGDRLDYLYGGYHSSGFFEVFGLIDEYNDLGIVLGANLKHPIVWRFFGELEAQYHKMFDRGDGDSNQLYLSYGLGFRF